MALATSIVAGSAIVMAAIFKFAPPPRTNTNGWVTREVCEVKHTTMMESLQRLERKVDHISSKLEK